MEVRGPGLHSEPFDVRCWAERAAHLLTRCFRLVLQIGVSRLAALRPRQCRALCRRRPDTLTIKWRHKGTGWTRTSASATMPQLGALTEQPTQAQVGPLVVACPHPPHPHTHTQAPGVCARVRMRACR